MTDAKSVGRPSVNMEDAGAAERVTNNSASGRKLPPLSEADFQKTLMGTLRALGWSAMHVRRSIGKKRQWTTTTSSVGWPDIVCLRGPWLLAIECKRSRKEKPTVEQVGWLERFALLPCARSWVLRADDPWEDVCAWIRYPESAPQTFGWTRVLETG